MLFFPALWMCAVFLGDLWGAIGGALWVVGRVILDARRAGTQWDRPGGARGRIGAVGGHRQVGAGKDRVGAAPCGDEAAGAGIRRYHGDFGFISRHYFVFEFSLFLIWMDGLRASSLQQT